MQAEIEAQDVPSPRSGVRLARLAQRERRRYGERIEPGGDMHEQSEVFLQGAASHATAAPPIRRRRRHEAWMVTWPPLLRLDSQAPVAVLVDAVIERLRILP